MATGRNNQKPQAIKKQPVKSRLSSRRTKNLDISLPFLKLDITLRKFRINKAKHSKRHKRFVFPLYFFPVKEVAITLNFKKPLPKSSSDSSQISKLTHILPRRQLAAPLLLIILGFSGAVYFGLNLKNPSLGKPIAANSVPAPEIIRPAKLQLPKTLSRSEPTRVRVAKIELDTALLSIGRNADSTMEVPVRYDIAGWYKYAPTPGEIGPAVIVGHVDRPQGIAVFWRLRELQPGDVIEVDRADGKTVKFKIDSVKQFPQDNFPTKEVYGNIDHSGIRLITCGGQFNTKTHQYSHNTVVYGSLII